MTKPSLVCFRILEEAGVKRGNSLFDYLLVCLIFFFFLVHFFFFFSPRVIGTSKTSLYDSPILILKERRGIILSANRGRSNQEKGDLKRREGKVGRAGRGRVGACLVDKTGCANDEAKPSPPSYHST